MVYVGAQINPDNPENEENQKSEVWSTRIWLDLNLMMSSIIGIRYITLERKVPYKFDFVPMGDSPERPKISVGGNLGSGRGFL